MLIISLVSVFSLSLIIWLLTKTKKTHPPLPPGPSGLPILGNLLSLDPELHSYFTTLARSFGPLFSLLLGSTFGVVVSSPGLAKEVLRDNDVVFANRDVPAAGRAATYGGADIVWTPYGPELRMLRKVCIRELLGPVTLESVYGLRRREVRRAVGHVMGRAGLPVRIGEEMFVTVMNVVTGMLWGGTVSVAAERETLGREFRSAVAELTSLLGTPNVSDFFPVLAKLDLQGVLRRMKKVAKKFDDVFERVIEQRLKVKDGNDQRQKDFLEVLLKMKDDYEKDDGKNEGEVSFTMIHVKALLFDMVVGGTDTTSNTVEFAMAEIINKPKILKKVQEELDTVVGKDGVVEEHHIYKLPYLQAIMKESLRLHPVLPLFVPHCPSQSCIVGGYTIPKGSRVFINVWAIHRDPEIWANPLEFDPERFLNGNKFDFTGNDFSYFPFGSGRRICAGIGMAERMVMFMLASLLHSFNWKLPEGEEMNLEEKFGIVLTKKIPLVLIPEPRFTNLALYD